MESVLGHSNEELSSQIVLHPMYTLAIAPPAVADVAN